MSRYVMEEPEARFILEDPPAPPARSKFDLKGEAYDRAANYSGRDAIGGTLRGAGSIGSFVARPFESKEANEERRARIDQNMQNLVGADPESMGYKAMKLVTELGGTLGAGGLIAKGLSLIPGASTALPTLIPAIQSSGMTANGAKGAYGLANRTAGGAVTGAASAGAVDPNSAVEGGVAGAALPVAAKTTYEGVKALARGGVPGSINPALQQSAKESIEAGYVIPPNMVQPSFKNQVVESIAGKQATQQIASVKNSQTTEKLVRDALGIPPTMMLRKETLESLRKTAGTAYKEVADLSPQAASDLEALKVARNSAQEQFNFYNRSGNPEALAKAKELRAQAENLENWLEFHAADAGKSGLIDSLRKARKEIAKTYTVERALNDAAGAVDARVLGRMYEKGVPLSDGLEAVGRFGSAFPTIAKTPQQIGSPAAHNLKSIAGMALGGGGFAALGPFGLAAATVPFVAPPLARASMFSKGTQQGLLGPSQRGLISAGVDESLPLLYRSAGLLAAQ